MEEASPPESDARAAKIVPFAGLSFIPRAEGGDAAWLAEISGTKEDSELGTGFARLRNARLAWTVKYDEVLIVLEGEIRVEVDGKALVAGPRDAIWLPAGSAVIYEAEDALVIYAIHPADWHRSMSEAGRP
ncbi:cupin domain-containing protein [Taklimakanibacter lacteus]|uniref:cupin domain-containing protein n=1 Tax=Taklimakanibacter lacteus TaxID=2268456 RepID=UPI0034D69738